MSDLILCYGNFVTRDNKTFSTGSDHIDFVTVSQSDGYLIIVCGRKCYLVDYHTMTLEDKFLLAGGNCTSVSVRREVVSYLSNRNLYKFDVHTPSRHWAYGTPVALSCNDSTIVGPDGYKYIATDEPELARVSNRPISVSVGREYVYTNVMWSDREIYDGDVVINLTGQIRQVAKYEPNRYWVLGIDDRLYSVLAEYSGVTVTDMTPQHGPCYGMVLYTDEWSRVGYVPVMKSGVTIDGDKVPSHGIISYEAYGMLG